LSALKSRIVQPEILDFLPEDHPAVIENRNDLFRLNRIAGNFSWFEKQVESLAKPGDSFIEPGAGGGRLGLHISKKLPEWPIVWTGLDLCGQPADWPRSWPWIQEDLLDFSHYTEYTGIAGNLILHQFEDDRLRRLGNIWNQHAHLLLFNEPARRRRHLLMLRATLIFGTHPITLHDGAISIRAGFTDEELPRLLGLDAQIWQWSVQITALGFYRMIARKKNLK